MLRVVSSFSLLLVITVQNTGKKSRQNTVSWAQVDWTGRCNNAQNGTHKSCWNQLTSILNHRFHEGYFLRSPLWVLFSILICFITQMITRNTLTVSLGLNVKGSRCWARCKWTFYIHFFWHYQFRLLVCTSTQSDLQKPGQRATWRTLTSKLISSSHTFQKTNLHNNSQTLIPNRRQLHYPSM